MGSGVKVTKRLQNCRNLNRPAFHTSFRLYQSHQTCASALLAVNGLISLAAWRVRILSTFLHHRRCRSAQALLGLCCQSSVMARSCLPQKHIETWDQGQRKKPVCLDVREQRAGRQSYQHPREVCIVPPSVAERC